MKTDGMSIATSEVYLTVGDVIDINGKRHKITKTTGRAMEVIRWYWWDIAFEWTARQVKRWSESS